MTLSVVIATINDSIATNLTIASCLTQLRYSSYEWEIILVDNGSSESELDNIQEFLKFHQKYPIKFFTYPIKGIIPPHSFGVLQASGEYILFLDPHVILPENYFETMVGDFFNVNKVGENVNSNRNIKMMFSMFNVGTIAEVGEEYIAGSHMAGINPFNKVNSLGFSSMINVGYRPVLSNSIASVITTKEWLLYIGNMFPESFHKAGGHTAEGLMLGLTTWMFGGKCVTNTNVAIEHPVYRKGYGAGRSANMHLSMAVGAYLLGGEECLKQMPEFYGEYNPGDLEEIIRENKLARDYVLKNQKISLKELQENWEAICVI